MNWPCLAALAAPDASARLIGAACAAPGGVARGASPAASAPSPTATPAAAPPPGTDVKQN
ncbi:hypothetical protein WMF31_07880 [Sorangium sp. So ce1036]|uniref:hypothetical protein n=1 Tax=Sorangium sp. So ce1036 TaxID=3133328 RepID=UPI003F0610A2